MWIYKCEIPRGFKIISQNVNFTELSLKRGFGGCGRFGGCDWFGGFGRFDRLSRFGGFDGFDGFGGFRF